MRYVTHVKKSCRLEGIGFLKGLSGFSAFPLRQKVRLPVLVPGALFNQGSCGLVALALWPRNTWSPQTIWLGKESWGPYEQPALRHHNIRCL